MHASNLRPPSWIRLPYMVSLVLVLAVGCNKPASPPPGAKSEPPATAIAGDEANARLKWNLRTLVEAYAHAGHTSPMWDGPARQALTEFARVRSQMIGSNEPWGQIVASNCVLAIKAGCPDPLIAYLHARFALDQTNSAKVFADTFCRIALEMEKSSYPNIRKFYACKQAGQQVTYTYGHVTNIPPEVIQLGIWNLAITNLLDALSDRTMPPEEFYDACHEVLRIWKNSNDQYARLYHDIDQKFPDNWTNNPLILLLKGEAAIEMAWHARGTGYADTITKQGWQLFRERLVMAENALTNAWRLNPNDPRIPLNMMRVERGQGRGRDRLELWFQRAIKLSTNNYDACDYKLTYLEPKWYGSVDDMLAFGRECVQNRQWGGHIPLILMDAHRAIQQQYTDDSEKTNYWKQPEVWLDLKDAFDRFFELNPEEISWYHNYAWYAYQAGQWATLNALIPKLGPVNYKYFGGQAEFDKMVALAREHASETQTNPLTVSIELKRLVTKIHARLDEGKTNEDDFTNELKEFDTLLAKHQDEKTDEVAQILFAKAMIYLQAFADTAKGKQTIVQLKRDFPQTRFGQEADQILASIEKQEAAKKIQLNLKVGTKFPGFNEADLQGKPLSPANYKGKIVLIDFWATWCGPCVAELPNVLNTYTKDHDRGFKVIGVSLDDNRDKLDSFLKQKNMPWPEYFDGQGWSNKLAVQFGIQSIPANFLLDGNGIIIGEDLRGEELEQAVAKALANH